MLNRRPGIVRFRQLGNRIRHRLSFIPGLYVIGAIVLVQVELLIDRALRDHDLPDLLTTTVDSGRADFTAIAGALITSITLLLSIMLITVQLASTQFSPRTLRNWLGNRQLQHTIGLTLGTSVFCLLGLRTTRSLGEDGGEIVPHITVITAVILGVAALFAVVGSVDHLTNSLRIGAVAQRLADETIAVIESESEVRAGESPAVVPAREPRTLANDELQIPDDATAVVTPTAGWVQQIDVATVLDAIGPGSTARIVVPLGGFATTDSPLLWMSAPDGNVDTDALLEGFALGDTRTMQQDVGFGLIQLTDIAVRALSPGINDPSTANDIIVHIGNVLTALWERPVASARTTDDGRTVISPQVEHADHLRRALDPNRRYGRADPLVTATLMRTLRSLRTEVVRRSLPGPIEPIETLIRDTFASADRTGWSAFEVEDAKRLASGFPSGSSTTDV
jgi:uncharacterized membrane protein